MSRDALMLGVAGVFFGILVGWIIGSQQSAGRVPPPPQTASAAAPAAGAAAQAQVAPLDESRVAALKERAARNPKDESLRVELANLYFDAGRFDEASQWYQQALTINPKDANVSTDLGITYYYTNQPDRALAQFDHSLQIDPKHAKTLFNIGIVRAMGKQDLEGAIDAWNRVIAAAPDSEEAKAARQALERIRAGHQNTGAPGGSK
jgi:tetratricopeptide (TPR) repeat protein